MRMKKLNNRCNKYHKITRQINVKLGSHNGMENKTYRLIELATLHLQFNNFDNIGGDRFHTIIENSFKIYAEGNDSLILQGTFATSCTVNRSLTYSVDNGL